MHRSRSVLRGGAEFQTSGLATNETRHVNTALLIADTDFVLPAVIALEYSMARPARPSIAARVLLLSSAWGSNAALVRAVGHVRAVGTS